jgi:hypothetical protein
LPAFDTDIDYAGALLERRLAAAGHYSDPWEIEPVPLDAWLRETRYVNLGFQPGYEQMMALRHIEWIYYPADWEALGWVRSDVKLINLMVLKWGKGSGKDTISQVGLLRICYLLQCLRNPQAYYGLGLNSEIHLLNTAVSAGQANSVFFQPLKTLIEGSAFFSDKSHATVTGVEFDKQIKLVSGHSETKSQEGMNLLAGVADEIAEFKTKDELEKASKSGQGREPKQSAEGVDKMLRSSGRSRFPEVFKAIYLSWTRFKGDYIEKMHEEGEKALAKNPAARWYISHKATWEANPSKKRSDFDDDYESDEIGSMAKYECRPPDARDRFFRNLVALGLSFPERQHNPITYSLVEGQDPDNPEQYGWQAEFAFADDFMPQRGAAYAVHIDLAHTSDKAGWAMSHVSGYRNRERENDDDKITRQAVVTLDAAMRFSQGPHGEIELRWARQLVFRLLERRFRIVYVTFDGWQSVDSIQTINARIATRNPKAPAEKKRVAENYSLDRNTEGYDTLKSMVYAGLYQGYRLPTVGEGPFEQPCIWWKELKALERQGGLATRARIDHPPYGSKDVADAIAGSCVGALHAAKVFGVGNFDDTFWTGGQGIAGAPRTEGGELVGSVASMGLGGLPEGW